ncbi:unnamed protein product [Thlaspi arvense]|uniref:TATA box-binding protein-associated factor RNA polymerase I subunit B n=1 Tax=Thlaspi arvense TaxID=13288 RepID=A0AAU9RLQ0_THLAR|nr:unnamed protein product [Thlaspi arvense]
MTVEIPMIRTECDNDAFDEDDGFFYCQQCGVREDDMIASAVDDEDLTGDDGGTRGAMYQRKHPRRLPPSHALTPSQLSYEEYYGQVRDRYVNGFLMMITLQCDALVEKFNVTPLIIGLVGPICLRLVALSGVFDDGWADKAILDSELHSKVRESKRRNREKELEPRNLDGKRAVTIWVSQLRNSLPLSSSLAISFLACHKAGATVLPTDIVRWAREGKVPYQSCFLKIQEKMGKRSAACPVEASVMFRPNQVVSAQRLEARAASIADIIGLRLPPVNLYGIASNYLNRLSITGQEKVLDLVRLIQKWSMPSDLYLSKNELRLPTRVCVMSIVIVAIRMLYNINGFGAWARSLGVVSEVSETKPDAEELSDVTKATEFDAEELLKNLEAKFYDVAAAESVDYEKDLLSYLAHGRNELFAGLVEASVDDSYRTVDNLWNGYTKDKVKSKNMYGTPLKRGREWEDDDVSLHQLSLDDTEFGDGNIPCTSPSRRSESMSRENHNQEEESKELSMTRLITDMRENLFFYIPPRVKVKRLDYLHYVRKIEDGAMKYPAHADYYILLRVWHVSLRLM